MVSSRIILGFEVLARILQVTKSKTMAHVQFCYLNQHGSKKRADLWEKPPFLRTRKAFRSRQEEEVCELLPVAQLCLTCCSQA